MHVIYLCNLCTSSPPAPQKYKFEWCFIFRLYFVVSSLLYIPFRNLFECFNALIYVKQLELAFKKEYGDILRTSVDEVYCYLFPNEYLIYIIWTVTFSSPVKFHDLICTRGKIQMEGAQALDFQGIVWLLFVPPLSVYRGKTTFFYYKSVLS